MENQEITLSYLNYDGFSQLFKHSHRVSSKELGFDIGEEYGTKEKEADDDDDDSGSGDEEENTAAMPWRR